MKILYRNWKGDVAWRDVCPQRLLWGETEYHPGKQLLLEVWDVDKQVVRTFAVKGILDVSHDGGGQAEVLRRDVYLRGSEEEGHWGDCPTLYDGCNCTVDALRHNIGRAERAEVKLRRLRGNAETALAKTAPDRTPAVDPVFTLSVLAMGMHAETHKVKGQPAGVTWSKDGHE